MSFRRVVLVLAAAMLCSVAAPSAASACQESSFCGYRNIGDEGTAWTYSQVNSPFDPGNTWFYVGGEANDQISSYINNRVHRTYMSKDYPASETRLCANREAGAWNLTEYRWPGGTNVNDSISSLYLDTGEGLC